MPDLKTLEGVYLTLSLLVPGFIASFVRSQFTTGRRLIHSDALLSYLSVSVIYYGLAFPFIGPLTAASQPLHEPLLGWFVLIFLGPAALGLLLGISVQRDYFRRVLQWCGLNPVHVIPTAWDWKFGRMASEWVLVTLKDGTRFAGFCGPQSFVSSDPNERDIYLQWIYDIDDQNKWSPRGENGVLIASGEVRTIEFWPYAAKEKPSDER